MGFIAADIPDFRERFAKIPGRSGDYEKQNKFYCEHEFPNFSLDRANPILVQVVEELGDAANGAHAKLRIAEVPDDIKWHIEEYDGAESVHEDHRVF